MLLVKRHQSKTTTKDQQHESSKWQSWPFWWVYLQIRDAWHCAVPDIQEAIVAWQIGSYADYYMIIIMIILDFF